MRSGLLSAVVVCVRRVNRYAAQYMLQKQLSAACTHLERRAWLCGTLPLALLHA